MTFVCFVEEFMCLEFSGKSGAFYEVLGETNFDFIFQVNVEKLQKISWQYDQSFFLIFLDDRSIQPPHVHIRNISEQDFFSLNFVIPK